MTRPGIKMLLTKRQCDQIRSRSAACSAALAPAREPPQYRTSQPPCDPWDMQERKAVDAQISDPEINSFGIWRRLAINCFIKHGPEEVKKIIKP